MLKTDDLWTDLKKDAATSTYVNLNTVATTDMHMGNEAWINGESFGSDCVAMSGGSDAYKLKSVGCTSSAKYACMKSGRFLKKVISNIISKSLSILLKYSMSNWNFTICWK